MHGLEQSGCGGSRQTAPAPPGQQMEKIQYVFGICTHAELQSVAQRFHGELGESEGAGLRGADEVPVEVRGVFQEAYEGTQRRVHDGAMRGIQRR